MPSSVPPVRHERLLRANNVATLLAVPVRTVRFWAATGRLDAFKDGPRIWRFRRESVEAFRNRGRDVTR